MPLRRTAQRIVLPCAIAALYAGPALARTPLSYLSGDGYKADETANLLWGLLCISVGVILIVGTFVLIAVWRARHSQMPMGPDVKTPVSRPPGGLSWIWVGVSVSMVALLFTVIWTMVVLANIATPKNTAPFTIEITGHQWWWEVRYVSAEPYRIFETANEIHIPVGSPVRIKLKSADVIHSFWVPALTGKTDLIPGQTNRTWIEADKPGTYVGQCVEYCGIEHARMGLRLIAQRPRNFQAWWKHQLQPAAPAPGMAAFVQHCGSCHAVRGTMAHGILGPNLSHLMTRKTIAAGFLPNTPGNLSGWIADPQSIKPGAYMPVQDLTGPELTEVRHYLETLN